MDVSVVVAQSVRLSVRNFTAFRPSPAIIPWIQYRGYTTTTEGSYEHTILPYDVKLYGVFEFGFSSVQPTGNLTMIATGCKQDNFHDRTVCDVQYKKVGDLIYETSVFGGLGIFPSFQFTPTQPMLGWTHFDVSVTKYYPDGHYPYISPGVFETIVPGIDEFVELTDTYRVYIFYDRMYSPPIGGTQQVVTYNSPVNITIVSEDPEPEDSCVRPLISTLPIIPGAYLRTPSNATHIDTFSVLPFESNVTVLTYIPPTQSNMGNIPRSTMDMFSVTIRCGNSTAKRMIAIDSRNPVHVTSKVYSIDENTELWMELSGFDERNISLATIVVTRISAPNGHVFLPNGTELASGSSMIRLNVSDPRLQYVPNPDTYGMAHAVISFVAQSADGFISPEIASLSVDVMTDRTPFRLDLFGTNPVLVSTSANTTDLRFIYFNFSEMASTETTYSVTLEASDPLGVSFERDTLASNPHVCNVGTNILSKLMVCRVESSDAVYLFSGYIGVYAPYEVDATFTLMLQDLGSGTLLTRTVTISAFGTKVPEGTCFVLD